MEESIPCRRIDGTIVEGLSSSEWEAYLRKYPNVSEQELSDVRDIQAPAFDRHAFEINAGMLDAQKARENRRGRHASLATPLFMLLSIEVKAKRKPFSVYGEITSLGSFVGERGYLYKRQFEDVEHFGSDGGYLTLNGPSPSCWSDDAFNVFAGEKLLTKLYDADHRVLVDFPIELAHSSSLFEQFNKMVVHATGLTLILKYLSIPMATYGRLVLRISNMSFSHRDSIKVYGKVVAKYNNTFGVNYHSEEIVLFKKNPDEYETLAVGTYANYDPQNIPLTKKNPDLKENLLWRPWVAVPVYSSLLVHIDLFEFGTNQQIVKEDVELQVQTARGFSKELVTTEFIITMLASWYAFYPPEEFKDADDSIQGELMDADDSIQGECEDADDSTQGECEDGGGDGVQISRFLRPCTTVFSFSAFEVFSVLICYKKSMPLKIHGLLQVLFNSNLDSPNRAINIFTKDKEDPLSLSERGNIIPLSEGPRRRKHLGAFSVICDLKDTLGELNIKGFQSCQYERILYPNRPLCSIIQGDHGFAALHYAIFTSAVQANLKVVYTENGLEGVGSPVYGSFFVEYNDFDRPSVYVKDCYKMVLFERIRKEDSLQVLAGGLVPLSRSSFVVPPGSSFTFYVYLMIGNRCFQHEETIKTERIIKSDTISRSIEGSNKEREVKIDLNWSEVQ